MSCNCGDCIPRGLICAPRGNSRRVQFSVTEKPSGLPFDLSDAAEIEFIVSQGKTTGGNMGPGGPVIFEKKLTDGDVIIGGGGDLFVVDILPADSVLPNKRLNYYEANVTTDNGEVYTVSAGVYQADETTVGGA